LRHSSQQNWHPPPEESKVTGREYVLTCFSFAGGKLGGANPKFCSSITGLQAIKESGLGDKRLPEQTLQEPKYLKVDKGPGWTQLESWDEVSNKVCKRILRTQAVSYAFLGIRID
jgi:hypothetical protein